MRRRLAGELGVPPYVVFSDATLEDLAHRRPASPSAFLDCKGVGPKKLESFGAAFLGAIAEYCEGHDLALGGDGLAANLAAAVEATAVSEPVASEPTVHVEPEPGVAGASSGGRGAARLQAAELFEAGTSIAEAVTQLERTTSTVVKYLCDWLRATNADSIAPWVDRDVQEAVLHAVAEVGDDRLLRPIFDHLGGDVDYESIRIVLAFRDLEQRREAAREAEG